MAHDDWMTPVRAFAKATRYKADGMQEGIGLEADWAGPWLVTIDSTHHEIHEGETWAATATWTGVSSGTSKYVRIVIPAGEYCHVVFEATSTAAFGVGLYEAPTTTGNGTTLPLNNVSRGSTLQTGVTAFFDPTVTGDGTMLYYGHVGGGVQKVGGQARSDAEWILQNNVYLIKVTSGAAGSDMTISFRYYVEGLAQE